MSSRDFRELLDARSREGKFLCVGFDPDITKIPAAVKKSGVRETLIAFNRAIVDATKDIPSTFKLNSAFYEAYGSEGVLALRDSIDYMHEAAPGVIVLLDAKRGDIGNTNEMYARSAFDELGADAVTVNPYMGGEPLEAFFAHKNKGIIVLCHTSNPGASELQEAMVGSEPLYQVVARKSLDWNKNGNCCVMVGATYPEQLGEVRAIVGDMPILIAGIGAQNGELEKTIQLGKNSKGQGLIINATRAIIYASSGADFAQAAQKKAQEYDGAIRAALIESPATV